MIAALASGAHAQNTTSTAAVWAQRAGEASGLDFEWDFYVNSAYVFTVPLFSATYLATSAGHDYFRSNIPPQAPGIVLTVRACRATVCGAFSNPVVIPNYPTPTPTDTATATHTPTATHSATPSRTHTSTATPSITATRTSTRTPLPEATRTPTRTATRTDTATPMPTVTPVPTNTNTPLPTPFPPMIVEIYHSGNPPVTVVVKTFTPTP